MHTACVYVNVTGSLAENKNMSIPILRVYILSYYSTLGCTFNYLPFLKDQISSLF